MAGGGGGGGRKGWLGREKRGRRVEWRGGVFFILFFFSPSPKRCWGNKTMSRGNTRGRMRAEEEEEEAKMEN